MKKKALFIVNPISGGKKKDGVPHLVRTHFDATTFEYNIIFTDGASHARQIAKEAVDDKYDLVIAVGGDGTINEVASSLAGSDTVLGIIPCGSGNGLSRFLHIPMNISAAIENLGTGHTVTIDTAEANGQPFFNMAGLGFDAHIAEVFSHEKKRGFVTYIKSIFSEVLNYKAQTYKVQVDGEPHEYSAFMLSFANSSQYGNNAHISPNASLHDGLIDVCVIKPFPLWRFIEMGIRMFNKTTGSSKYVEILRGKNIKVKRVQPGPLHLDGEPQMAGADIEIKVLPASLKVIAGDTYISK